MSEKLRRLDLYLPENHPIFQYPKGARTKIAKEWLDTSLTFKKLETEINEIKTLIIGLNSSSISTKDTKEKQENSKHKSTTNIDVSKFLSALEDI